MIAKKCFSCNLFLQSSIVGLTVGVTKEVPSHNSFIIMSGTE